MKIRSGDYWSKIRMSSFDQFLRFYRTEIEKISESNLIIPWREVDFIE